MRNVISLLALLSLVACQAGDRIADAGPGVVALDSVRLQETDSLYLGAVAALLAAPDGSLYAADPMNGHVLHFAVSGEILRRIGRKGEGPGELLAPLTLAISGDSLLVVADAASGRTSLFDARSGQFRRSLAHEGLPFGMQAMRDTIWVSDVNHLRQTSLAALAPGADSLHYFGPLPQEYLESRMLMQIHPYATLVRMDDAILVGFTGHRALFRVRPDGGVLDTIVIPVARRRGVPDDMVRRLSDPNIANSEIASMASTLAGLHRLPSGEIAALYFDVTYKEPLITADVYLSVLSPDLKRACVDAPIEFAKDGRPTLGFRGDTLLALEPRVEAGTSAAVYLKRYQVSTKGCNWVPTGASGAGAQVASR